MHISSLVVWVQICGLALAIAINRGWRQSSLRYDDSDKIKAVDNAHKTDYCIAIPSSGTSRSYSDFNHTYSGEFWKQGVVSLVQALKVQDFFLKRSKSLEQGVAVSFVISHVIIK